MLLFYNDKQSFQNLLRMMKDSELHQDTNSALNYHITLVQLLANCTEGKNVYTEIKCHSLLPLDDIVRVVTSNDCIPEVSYHSHRLRAITMSVPYLHSVISPVFY